MFGAPAPIHPPSSFPLTGPSLSGLVGLVVAWRESDQQRRFRERDGAEHADVAFRGNIFIASATLLLLLPYSSCCHNNDSDK